MLRNVMGRLLSPLAPRRCPFCRKRSEALLCPDCQISLPWAVGNAAVTAPLYYRGRAREALLRFKFQGVRHLAKPLGKLMSQAARDAGLRADCVSYVPSGRWRTYWRGYAHTKLLADVVARELGLPRRKLLRKTKAVCSQTKMYGDTERIQNVRNVFAAAGDLCGERVLLCDDICTSGATLRACREALLAAGAGEVLFLTAARR